MGQAGRAHDEQQPRLGNPGEGGSSLKDHQSHCCLLCMFYHDIIAAGRGPCTLVQLPWHFPPPLLSPLLPDSPGLGGVQTQEEMNLSPQHLSSMSCKLLMITSWKFKETMLTLSKHDKNCLSSPAALLLPRVCTKEL